MFLQAPCRILIYEFAWLESPISYSIGSNVHRDSVYLTCHTVHLLLTVIAFRVLDSITSYGQSKRVIKFDEFDQSKSWESKNNDAAISLKKIAVILPWDYLQHHGLIFKNKTFWFLSYPWTTYFCKYPAKFPSIDPRRLDERFLVPSYLMIRFYISNIRYCVAADNYFTPNHSDPVNLLLIWKFVVTNNDHLHKIPPKNRANKWRCSNLPKGK
jgi:hypothetical protein